MAKQPKRYRCVRSAAGSLYRISEGETYTAADFTTKGGLKDALVSGFLEEIEEPAPAPRKRRSSRSKSKK